MSVGDVRMARLLVEKAQVDVNAEMLPEFEGNTPLHVAADYAHLNILRYLISLSKPKDASVTTSQQTPTTITSQVSSTPAVQVLMW